MRRMYSESELRRFIQEHGADVVASLVGKDIKVNKIETEEPLFEQNIAFPATVSGFSLEPIYCKVVQWNHTLRIIISLKVTNDGEESANIPSIQSTNISLDDSVKAKIYDIDGKTLSEEPLTANTNIIIRGNVGICVNHSGGNTYISRLSATRYNSYFNVNLGGYSNIPVPAGEARYIFSEMALNI